MSAFSITPNHMRSFSVTTNHMGPSASARSPHSTGLLDPSLAELIVHRPLLRVPQHGVRFRQPVELHLVAAVVWMLRARRRSVCLVVPAQVEIESNV